MRLTPGVQVFPAVIAQIDTNGDGVLSEAERQAYSNQVLHDLSLTVDGQSLQPRVVSATFPKVGEMRNGLGDMPSSTMLLALLAFSLGVEIGHQMVVLPLFAVLKIARQTQPDNFARTHLPMTLQRTGSVAISIAGGYYLCLALSEGT